MPVPRRRGRPPEGPRVSVRLPPHIVSYLDRQAAQQRSTRAKLIRDILTEATNRGADDGVDRAQIRRQLGLTPAQRVSHMVAVANTLAPLRGVAAR